MPENRHTSDSSESHPRHLSRPAQWLLPTPALELLLFKVALPSRHLSTLNRLRREDPLRTHSRDAGISHHLPPAHGTPDGSRGAVEPCSGRLAQRGWSGRSRGRPQAEERGMRAPPRRQSPRCPDAQRLLNHTPRGPSPTCGLPNARRRNLTESWRFKKNF